MRDLAIAVNVGSPASTLDLFKTTIKSYEQCLEGCDYCVFIGLGEKVSKPLRAFIENISLKQPQRYKIIFRGEQSYAQFLNLCFDQTQDFIFFAQSHDDVKLITSNFWQKFMLEYSSIDSPLGLISFLDVGYRLGDYSPSTRPGFHIDFICDNAWESGRIFQFHKFPELWYLNKNIDARIIDLINRVSCKAIKKPLLKYPKVSKLVNTQMLDLPIRPIKVHGAFNHFIIFTQSARKAIKKCVDWETPNALLIDEDFSLTCTYHGLNNILIPSIEYIHFRSEYVAGGETRSVSDISKNKIRVEKLFERKWGFPSRIKTEKDLMYYSRRNTNKELFWSAERKSYDWFYL
jgi:hypothetical protein